MILLLTMILSMRITPDTDLVVICNPNNPTGQLTSRELLVHDSRQMPSGRSPSF